MIAGKRKLLFLSAPPFSCFYDAEGQRHNVTPTACFVGPFLLLCSFLFFVLCTVFSLLLPVPLLLSSVLLLFFTVLLSCVAGHCSAGWLTQLLQVKSLS